MLKNINQSMVNRSIAGGGVNCKCFNGGSNGNGVSGGSSSNGIGKVILEFNIYDGADGDAAKAYMTEEDARKIYTQLYNVYPTEYVIFNYDYLSGISGQELNFFSNAVMQNVSILEINGITLLQSNILMQVGNSNGNDIILRYPDKNLDFDIKELIQIHIDEKSIEIVDSNDSILEGATETKASITFYYMKR